MREQRIADPDSWIAYVCIPIKGMYTYIKLSLPTRHSIAMYGESW